MRWSYAELMDLPDYLYPELVEWLTKKTPTVSDFD